MAAGVYDITIEQGATFELDITWNDSSGSPVVLTGYSAEMMARTTYDAATTLFALDGGDIILTSPGNIRITIPSIVTSTFPAGSYVYDLELTSGSGTVYRLIQGVCTVSPEVTY